MTVRRFKPGDRVRRCDGGPIMQVLNYVLENRPFVGRLQSDHLVECVWYENGNRRSQVFHQEVLVNEYNIAGLFRTNSNAQNRLVKP
jgi:uncharacterized protein YodC (DUF2158 family)